MTTKLNTEFIERCLKALDQAFRMLHNVDQSSIEYDLYRAAVIKEFELVLEQSGKLLRKLLKPYFHSSREVDRLTFKDVFRYASKHTFLNEEQTERWMHYRDNRYTTAHDYGFEFANKTLEIIPQFIEDAKALVEIIRSQHVDS